MNFSMEHNHQERLPTDACVSRKKIFKLEVSDFVWGMVTTHIILYSFINKKMRDDGPHTENQLLLLFPFSCVTLEVLNNCNFMLPVYVTLSIESLPIKGVSCIIKRCT